MIGINLSITARLRSGGFGPAILFAASEPGIWLDPSDVANLSWRRNLLTYTEQFDNVVWGKDRVTLTTNGATDPIGTSTAEIAIPTAVLGTHGFGSGPAVSYVSGLSYTATVYAKAFGYNWLRFRVNNGASNLDTFFNLATGGFGLIPAGVTAVISDAGNGWYRCECRFTAAATTTTVFACQPHISTGDGVASFTGDGTSGIYIWGAQVEQAASATAYQRITNVNREAIDQFPSSTLYQDSFGTTIVTTPGQPVGLALDKSRGLVLGPQVWPDTALEINTLTVVGVTIDQSGVGVLAINDNSYTGRWVDRTANAIVIEPGKTYEVIYTISELVGGETGTRLGFGDSNLNNNPGTGQLSPVIPVNIGVGTFRQIIPPDASTANRYAGVFNSTAGGVAGHRCTFFSVKELPGKHAIQGTAAARPTYGIVPATARRNLLTYTEDFSNAFWVKTNTSVTAGAAVAPDSTTTGWQLTENAANSSHTLLVSSAPAFNIANATAHHQFVYLKANTRSVVFVQNEAAGTGFGGAFINLTTGAVSNYFNGLASGITTEDAGNGWWKVNLSFTSVVIAGRMAVSLSNALGTQSYLGDGVSSVYVWHPQLEVGSAATAYQKVISAFDVTEAGVASLHYLGFDGVDDFLVTPAITTATDKVQLFAGVRKLRDTAQSVVAEYTTTFGNGSFTLQAPVSAANNYFFGSRGTAAASVQVAGYTAPETAVLTGLGDIGGDSAILRRNGVQIGSILTDQGTGNYNPSASLFIGRRNGSQAPFQGNIFSLIARFGPNLTADLISQSETHVAEKSGLTL